MELDKLILIVVIVVVIVVIVWVLYKRTNQNRKIATSFSPQDIIRKHREIDVEFLPFERKGKHLTVHTAADLTTNSAQAGSSKDRKSVV